LLLHLHTIVSRFGELGIAEIAILNKALVCGACGNGVVVDGGRVHSPAAGSHCGLVCRGVELELALCRGHERAVSARCAWP
jgi:hypothetical protein